MKISVTGVGYVGLSLAILLSQKNEVVAYDINKEKIDKINKRIPTIEDNDIEYYFKTKKLNLTATTNYKEAFKNADYIIISTPTNYDEEEGYFDTTSIEENIKKIIETNSKATIVIKSTVPVGYTEKIKRKYKINIMFSPEFLREGKALYDNLYPSRIIIGSKSKKAKEFAQLLKDSSLKKDVKIKLMDSSEAEAVKLFSNTFLALRVAFFNELDTFALVNKLNTKDIIEGVCLDDRIGNYYNNPSFGYGGYCLPKDTKQLLKNYKNIPQNIIESTIKSNDTRKDYIAKTILEKHPKTVGIYHLTMKKESDNFRESAIIGVIERLQKSGIKIIIYEPILNSKVFQKCKVINDFNKFIDMSDIVLANRLDSKLKNNNKFYTRDIFNKD